jgi:hypothetical protein
VSGGTHAPKIGDDVVRSKTGLGWDAWFAALDAAGAAKLDHPGIVKLVAAHGGASAWWQQGITVEYEKARGLRATHQKPGGFEISGSKTVAVPVETLYDAFHDDAVRARWLAEPITIRKATRPKSLRITWADGTHVDVYLTAKGEAKSQVSLGHLKIGDADEAARLKEFWAARLAALKDVLD